MMAVTERLAIRVGYSRNSQHGSVKWVIVQSNTFGPVRRQLLQVLTLLTMENPIIFLEGPAGAGKAIRDAKVAVLNSVPCSMTLATNAPDNQLTLYL
jgi:hypothetical protein